MTSLGLCWKFREGGKADLNHGDALRWFMNTDSRDIKSFARRYHAWRMVGAVMLVDTMTISVSWGGASTLPSRPVLADCSSMKMLH